MWIVDKNGMTRLLCAMLVYVGMLGCTGCGESDGGEESESPSATSSLASQAKTDLGRRILADGQISAAEWAEVKQAYTDCIHETYPDVSVTWEDDHSGARSLSVPNSETEDSDKMAKETEEFQNMEQACETSTDFDVISRIQDLGSDPDKDTTPELVQCLISKGLVDSSMTVEEYKQIISDPDKSSETFGAYNDPSNPQYDEQKAQEWQACQEGEGTS